MFELTAPPPGYSAAVYRVAENLSGSVPFASVTYELPGPDGHPRSILSLIGNPRGAYAEPLPIRGSALATNYRSGAGYEVSGKDRTIHFWYGGDVLYTFMHINYDSKPDVVGLTASGRLIESLRAI